MYKDVTNNRLEIISDLTEDTFVSAEDGLSQIPPPLQLLLGLLIT